jgi:glycosyltransferase involved in cell wall biosynthesis
MTFLIVTHLIHKRNKNQILGGYAPYIREMNLWLKYFDKCIVVAPLINTTFTDIDLPYSDSNKICFQQIPAINFLSVSSALLAVVQLPSILFKIGLAMSRADHIHLRCPGNIGLLGSCMQIFFPFKRKTAKYAGNWDPNAKQPLSYRLQKRILQSSISKNMKVLVYGEWPDQTQNVLPFFTASYSENEIEPKPPIEQDVIRIVFVGTLTSNKNPLLAIQVVQHLLKNGMRAKLELLGDGSMKNELEHYINANHLQQFVLLRGNLTAVEVKKCFMDSHFLIFLSDSEGWPKAVAEAMFWGCVPVVQPVSCVAWMLGFGARGILVDKKDLQMITERIISLWSDPSLFTQMLHAAMEWSRNYTLEKFESEIKKLV